MAIYKAHIASTIAGLATRHPAYALLAGRVCVADIHRLVGPSFSDWIVKNSAPVAYPPHRDISHVGPKFAGDAAKLDPNLVKRVREDSTLFDSALVHSQDFDLS